ncbi:hypothetical protein GUJ93_ZPchr0011g28687 [Zizania palustris]|uniref:DUF538 family protein n=1 Tax=Zizania palustris TaxID=103762 RepID=A0A8J6BRF0_ZIZPA|nr:hypothetical protein GUJ93_ZPchr0011g28687 [Zizania palustris]
MAKLFLLAAVVFALAIASPAIAADDSMSPSAPPPLSSPPTAYKMLGKFGFPPGLLPVGVQGYNLAADNSFEVDLAVDCEFRAAKKYVLHYSSRIAGSITDGSITSLDGVKVKIAFAWLRISQVDVDGDNLKMRVGPFTKSFSVDTFAVSPQCN